MTTVVIHDNKVYCDSQATAGNMITDYNVEKAVNLGQCIVVGAGRWSHVVKFQNWVADNLMAEIAQQEHPYAQVQMPEEMVEDDFQGAILYPDGVVVMFEGASESYECNQPIFLGSGAPFAAGAIAAGADGVQAVMSAIQLDPYSGGDIKVEGFEEEKAPPTKEYLSKLSKEDILATLFPEDKVCSGEEEPYNEVKFSFQKEDSLEPISTETVMVVDKEGNDYALFTYTKGEGDVGELELLDEDSTSFIINSEFLTDLPVSELKSLCKDLGIKFSHNSKDTTLAKNIVAYFEVLIK